MTNENKTEEQAKQAETNEGGISPEILAAAEQAVEGQNINGVAALTPEEEIQDLTDKYLRSLAEMQNLRGRVSKDLDDARKYAINNFANDLIPVLENLHRAKSTFNVETLNTDPALKNIVDGVEMTLKALEEAFKKNGIERISPQAGDDFDYKVHQAVVQVPTNDIEAGKIFNMVEAGYTIKDRILRPAIVAVAKKLEEAAA
jgi:molecular chaperone GrpE